MNEDHLRAVIREAVARHLAQQAPSTASLPSWKAHPSHGLLPMLAAAQNDGPCIIEPAVKCHHCSFCQSLGH